MALAPDSTVVCSTCSERMSAEQLATHECTVLPAEPRRDPKSRHYRLGPPLSDHQAIDVIEASMSRPAFVGFLHGSALKYLLRLAHKPDGARDAEKAAFYCKWLHETLEQA